MNMYIGVVKVNEIVREKSTKQIEFLFISYRAIIGITENINKQKVIRNHIVILKNFSINYFQLRVSI